MNENIETVITDEENVTDEATKVTQNTDVTDTEADSMDTATVEEAPISKPDNSDGDGDTLESLRRKIEELQGQLEAKRKEQDTILSELGEFNRLFPNISARSLPQEVWSRVESGLPLSAAYALYAREEDLRREHAGEINKRNLSLSAGGLGKEVSCEYFSPDEVRKMTRKEVHDNYQKIKNSMKFWR